ncbi:hypothetical protein [Roseomonas harenae]|uniref:hypothetical protein n=1 Tax=Muricoccus harenae TaxID=2692566 RepID=UPI0013311EB7|nr:hypothetical protein [Roseomonas harenae]
MLSPSLRARIAAELERLIANSAAERVGELQRLSTITGLAVADLQELGSGARAMSGVELDNFTDSVQELQNAMGEGASGENKNIVALFRKMRIPLTEMRNGRREVRSLASVLPQLADAFQNTQDPPRSSVKARAGWAAGLAISTKHRRSIPTPGSRPSGQCPSAAQSGSRCRASGGRRRYREGAATVSTGWRWNS